MSTLELERMRRSAPRRVSLRLLLVAGLVVLILLTMLLVSLSVLKLLREAVEREARRSATASAAALAIHPESEPLPEGLSAVILVDNGQARARLGTLPEALLERVTRTGRSEVTTLEGSRVVVAAAPTQDGRFLVVALPMEAQDKLVANAQGLVVLFLVLVGIFVLIVGYLVLTRVLVRPVRRLVAAAERVGRGDLETPVRVGGSGEIAELSDRFNAMMTALRDERAQLQATLEEQRRINAALENAQDRLVRSQRLASIGRLAAGVAHEIGNPLASILAYLELCQDEDTEEDEIRSFLPHIESATQRIHHIIRGLLDYSRASELELRPMSPRGAIRQTLELLAPQPGLRQIQVVDATPEDLPTVTLDESRLVQLLLNLCLNAADAIEGAGTLTLSVQSTDDHLEITVEDTGPGIAPDVLPHIFEPFFTTKAPGAGTGLGLAICEQIAEQLGAELSVQSTLGEGTRFTLELKRA